MKLKNLLFPPLAIYAVITLIHRLLAESPSAKPVSNHTMYDGIDAYVEGQMRRLKILGISLAIVERDKIVHLRGFGRARPGGEAPTPQTPFFIGSVTNLSPRWRSVESELSSISDRIICLFSSGRPVTW